MIKSKNNKNIQTEQNYLRKTNTFFSRFEVTRGDENQIFRTYFNCKKNLIQCQYLIQQECLYTLVEIKALIILEHSDEKVSEPFKIKGFILTSNLCSDIALCGKNVEFASKL